MILNQFLIYIVSHVRVLKLLIRIEKPIVSLNNIRSLETTKCKEKRYQNEEFKDFSDIDRNTSLTIEERGRSLPPLTKLYDDDTKSSKSYVSVQLRSFSKQLKERQQILMNRSQTDSLTQNDYNICKAKLKTKE